MIRCKAPAIIRLRVTAPAARSCGSPRPRAAPATAAADFGAQGFAEGLRLPAIAVAKSRAGEAAGIGAAIAHQIHGAIGFTYEHSLHFLTRRLWAWRDEYGGEAEWNLLLGRHLAAAGADRLWPELTAL